MTDQYAAPASQEPADDGGGSNTRLILIIVLGIALIAGVIAIAVVVTDDDDTSTTSSSETTGDETASAAVAASIQQDLATLGYYDGPIDGVYGAETEAAVKEFQTDAGLEPTGRYDPATDAAVQAALAEQGEEASQTVKEIQTVLSDLGWYTGPIDGVYGPATTQAVVDFQTFLGVTPDGIVGPETIAAFDAKCADRSACVKPAGTATPTPTATGTATAEPTATPEEIPKVRLTVPGMDLDMTLEVRSCESSSATSVELKATTESADLTLSASDPSPADPGTLVLNGVDANTDGPVEAVNVEEGGITASGFVAGDDGQPTPFELVGDC
jgi:peptidoglycan hydrolase-like protein with peptidoglycan-binding domain